MNCKERSWKNPGYFSASHTSPNLLSYTTRINHTVAVLTSVSLALPYQSSIKKNASLSFLQAKNTEAFFFNWDSFFPDKCSLCKVNTNRIDKQIKTRQPTWQVISLIGKQNIQMKRWKLVSIDKQHIYIYFVKEIQARWQRSTGKLETNADGDWGQREPSFLFVGL